MGGGLCVITRGNFDGKLVVLGGFYTLMGGIYQGKGSFCGWMLVILGVRD